MADNPSETPINAGNMNANSAAEGALRTYLRMTNPGYAVLIDAPWGAGKTHFIRRIFPSNGTSADARIVTLNGVSDEATFRRALLKESFDPSKADKVALIADIAAKQFQIGGLGSIARDIVEERLISKLPDTIVFDDVERSSIKISILFGLINEFVEHKKKHIILIANSDEFRCKDAFITGKEKIIGRTIRIVPDLNAALPEFFSLIGTGAGRSYFEKHCDIVTSVFEQAGHQNLRLLRNSVRECAMILDRIENGLFAGKEAMARFVRTYLALAMALAKGEIEVEHLADRDNWKVASSEHVEDHLRPLHDVYNRHEGADILTQGSSALPQPLCKLLFLKGHADDDVLNDFLKTSGQFDSQDENPLWKRLIYWHDCSLEELATRVREGKDYLFCANPVEAGPYLHIAASILRIEGDADSMLRIEGNGGLETSRSDLTDKIVNRVSDLGAQGGLPAAILGRQYGWASTEGRFSFGGYGIDMNDEFIRILGTMREGQASAYQITADEVSDNLLSFFKTNLDEFLSMISSERDGLNFYRVPILHTLDTNKFACATLSYLCLGKSSELGVIFEKLAERHRTNDEWQDEQFWAEGLRRQLVSGVADRSRLAAAQLENFLRRHWKFEPPETSRDDLETL